MATTTLTLYETVDALNQVAAWLEETEGDLTPEIEQLLEQAGHDFADKVERVAAKITELRATARAQKDEADRLAARARASTNGADRLARYLERQLEASGRDKVQGLRFTVALQLNAPKLVGDLTETQIACLDTDDPSLAPCVRLVPARFELDRAQALLALKEGRTIDGLSITRTRSLRIR